MRFSQFIAFVLFFSLTLGFDVSAKPSWKDTSSTTEKPGGKKNRKPTNDTGNTDPIIDDTTDTTNTAPVANDTTDTTNTDPIANDTTDTTTNEEPLTETTTEPTATGAVTLTWDIPLNRENGDYLTLEELEGYEIFVRNITSGTEYFVMITDPTTTQWDFAELASGIWEFSIASIDTRGLYSSYSPITEKTIY